MSEKQKSRAEIMASQYGPKLQEMGVIPAAKEIHKIAVEQITGQKANLKKAVAKLRTFYDQKNYIIILEAYKFYNNFKGEAMNNVLDEHRSFLHKYKILDSLVLDGTGMEKSEIVEIMNEKGYLVVVGVAPCYRNHSIRKKSWHCVECKPDRLIYQDRFTKKSTIYSRI